MRELEKSTRRPNNEAEGAFFDLAEKHGWTLTKRGWPDFFCFKNGRLALVEIKPDDSPLKDHQRIVMEALADFGVPCFRWSPNRGFTRIRATPMK